ncbi:hypothetical protein IPA_08300 [Ignicoccus pacificus DSM 13166]|uniref:Uncharacterized protein n=1 Tax=Ignicoccus pacificus DSM 13166 TaxID=940294 RepID=A0A977KBX2_9CREN|nr:hypothetical protein IPA_08300 [Ignicoccus pacificus DSM 13166]
MTTRKLGISSIIAEILLVAITLALSAVVYSWTMVLMNMLSKGVFPQLSEVIAVAEGIPATKPLPSSYFILISFRNTMRNFELQSVRLYFGDNVVCQATSFVLSGGASNARDYNCKAVRVAGYYGLVKGALDDDDAIYPGAYFVSSGCGSDVGEASANDIGVSWFKVVSDTGKAPPWATVVAGIPEGTFVGSDRYETYFNPTPSPQETYVGYSGDVKVYYNDTSGTWVYLPSFNTVKLGPGTYTIVMWCPHLGMPTGKVKVEIDSSSYSLTYYVKSLS